MTGSTFGVTANGFLTQIVLEIKSGNLRRCEAMGLTLEEIKSLNKLTVEDLHYLVNTPVSILTFHVNHQNLHTLLEQAHREQHRIERIDRALGLGGSIELMQHFFGMTASEVSSRRRLVGIATRQGRNVTPSEADEVAVWQQWQSFSVDNVDSLDGLESMMLIAEQQHIPLTTVWRLIRDWAEQQQRREV